MAGPTNAPAPRYALTKWWKSHVYTVGLKTQLQSPYRQDHLTPWVRHWPDAARKKITDNFWDVVPAFSLGIFVVWWADRENDLEHRKHRS